MISIIKWIEIADKTPKENELVFLTFRSSIGMHIEKALFRDDAFYFINDVNEASAIVKLPIAWAEIPKPYEMEVRTCHEVDRLANIGAAIEKAYAENSAFIVLGDILKSDINGKIIGTVEELIESIESRKK